MTKTFTNGTKTIITNGVANDLGNVWYQSERNGKVFGRSFRMTEERFVSEFWEVIQFEPSEETLDEIVARDKKGGR